MGFNAEIGVTVSTFFKASTTQLAFIANLLPLALLPEVLLYLDTATAKL